jgi:hypothetical protein
MTDVRVESVEHDNQSFGCLLSRISKGSELDKFFIIVEHLELNEVFDGEDMFSLRVRKRLFKLLGVLDSKFALFFC